MTLISVGNAVVDIVARVPTMPERGGDVLASESGMSVGGAFNAMLAALRQGMHVAYAGGHGVGFFGDLVRARFVECGIDILLPPDSGSDSGYDIALVDEGGERTFVTAFGAEARISATALDTIVPAVRDWVHVSGYGLLDATNVAALVPWLTALDPRVRVFFDPGVLVVDIRPAVLKAVLGRADWVSCNEREAIGITGAADARAAIDALAGTSTGAVVRLGASGCLVASSGEVRSVAGFDAQVVDTNGAGDAHSGAFIAALEVGLSPVAAAVRANACAAIAVSRSGPATSPMLDEVLRLIDSAGRGGEF